MHENWRIPRGRTCDVSWNNHSDWGIYHDIDGENRHLIHLNLMSERITKSNSGQFLEALPTSNNQQSLDRWKNHWGPPKSSSELGDSPGKAPDSSCTFSIVLDWFRGNYGIFSYFLHRKPWWIFSHEKQNSFCCTCGCIVMGVYPQSSSILIVVLIPIGSHVW